MTLEDQRDELLQQRDHLEDILQQTCDAITVMYYGDPRMEQLQDDVEQLKIDIDDIDWELGLLEDKIKEEQK